LRRSKSFDELSQFRTGLSRSSSVAGGSSGFGSTRFFSGGGAGFYIGYRLSVILFESPDEESFRVSQGPWIIQASHNVCSAVYLIRAVQKAEQRHVMPRLVDRVSGTCHKPVCVRGGFPACARLGRGGEGAQHQRLERTAREEWRMASGPPRGEPLTLAGGNLKTNRRIRRGRLPCSW